MHKHGSKVKPNHNIILIKLYIVISCHTFKDLILTSPTSAQSIL